MRALDIGEHTDTTDLAAWQIDLGAWWVIDSYSKGYLSFPACVCVCFERESQSERERREKVKWRERQKGWCDNGLSMMKREKKHYSGAEKVIVGNLMLN